MYEDMGKMIPKIAISDQNTIKIKLLNLNEKYHLNIFSCLIQCCYSFYFILNIIHILNGMFLKIFSPKMVVNQNNALICFC